MRGAAFTRTVRVRVPKRVRPGRHSLVLSGADQPLEGDDAFLELLVGGGAAKAPATLGELVKAIEGIGRYDGVSARIGRRSFRAFRDAELLVTGRASTRVRVR